MKKNWFEDQELWAEFREQLYEDKWDKADRQVQQIMDLTGIKQGKVLDIPCGPGRHSLALARTKRFEVTGVDLSEKALDQARSFKEQEQLNADFKQADMREHIEKEKFDLILNLFTSFGYFNDEENIQTLENFYKSLKPGGKLVLETLTKETLFNDIPKKHWEEREDHYFLMEKEITSDWRWLKMEWTKINDSGEEFSREVRIRLYSIERLHEILTEIGFSNVEFYSDFEGNEVDFETEKMVLVAEK